jgi:ribonuclease HII
VITGGLDEVGWCSWAGFVLSAVAVFKENDLTFLPPGVTDSKQVSEKNREALYLPITNVALDIGFGHAWPWEIDDLGPSRALQLSYTRAIQDLKYKPDLLYVDGNNPVQSWIGRQIVEPKGDLKYRQVSAASIVAKVSRDRAMADLHKKFPAYGWDSNKGYGSRHHEAAIHRLGLIIGEKTPMTYIHRLRYCEGVLNRKAVKNDSR